MDAIEKQLNKVANIKSDVAKAERSYQKMRAINDRNWFDYWIDAAQLREKLLNEKKHLRILQNKKYSLDC